MGKHVKIRKALRAVAPVAIGTGYFIGVAWLTVTPVTHAIEKISSKTLQGLAAFGYTTGTTALGCTAAILAEKGFSEHETKASAIVCNLCSEIEQEDLEEGA